MYVGGILGVSTSSFSADETSISETYFRIAPEFGYFVRDNLRVGGSLGYSIAPLEGRTTHTVTIGPNVAYYVKVCDRIYYVPEIGLGFAYASFDGASGVGLDSGIQIRGLRIPPFFQMEPFAESHVARLYHAVVPGGECNQQRRGIPARHQPNGRLQFYF